MKKLDEWEASAKTTNKHDVGFLRGDTEIDVSAFNHRILTLISIVRKQQEALDSQRESILSNHPVGTSFTAHPVFKVLKEVEEMLK